MENNRDKINGIVAQHRPVILSVSEANLRQEVNDQLVNIQVYKILDLKARYNTEIKRSRLVIYMRVNLKFDRTGELENTEDAMCWINKKMQGGCKIMCGFVYQAITVNGQNSAEAHIRR